MKHIEELKIGATAITFCLIMLLVYAVFPQDGFVPATKAPMPEIPSAEDWDAEEDYGFQIYSEESNYDDSSSDTLSDTTEDLSETTEGISGTTENLSDDTVSDNSSVPEQTDPVSDIPQDTGSESLPAEDDTGSDPSYAVEPSIDESYDPEAEEDIYEDDSYQGDSPQDEFHWEETEETYHFE